MPAFNAGNYMRRFKVDRRGRLVNLGDVIVKYCAFARFHAHFHEVTRLQCPVILTTLSPSQYWARRAVENRLSSTNFVPAHKWRCYSQSVSAVRCHFMNSFA